MSTESLVVRALGTSIGIRIDRSLSPSERAEVVDAWRGLRTGDPPTVTIDVHKTDPGATPRSPFATAGAVATTVTGSTVRAIGERLSSEITLAGLSGLRGKALLLHAAGLALDDGRVIGLIGPSGRGKTTAARQLSTSLGYVTDEALAVLPDLSVIPYAKPLSIVQPLGGKDQRSADDLGLRPANEGGLALSALVLLDRRPGVEAPFVERVDLNPGFAQLLEQSSFLIELPRPLQTLAELVMRTGGLRRVVYSEATTLHSAVPAMLDTVSDAPALRPVPAPEPVDGPGMHRGDYADAILLDDDLFILRPGEIVILSGLGPSIWIAAQGASRDDLLAAALAELGTPPEGVDAGQLVDQAIADLLERDLIVRT